MKTNVFFLIRSLGAGGAERQLVELVKHMDESRFSITVAVFYDKVFFGQELTQLKHIRLVSLNKKGRWDVLSFLLRLIQEIHLSEAQIIHGYLDVANVFALLAGLITRKKVVFGIRNANMDLSKYDWTAMAVYRLTAWLSHFADHVVFNSFAGFKYHTKNGFSKRNVRVIPNGVDLSLFKPDSNARKRQRAEWHIKDNEILVGIVGRLDPMKDHENFLQAAARLKATIPGIRFVCVGSGAPRKLIELKKMAEILNLSEDILWYEARSNVTAIYNALDVLVSASRYGEGFPNVVAEAMACEILCAATDVGDSALIVADTGRVCPSGDPVQLANAVDELLKLPLEKQKTAQLRARQHIIQQFSVEKMARATELMFLDVINWNG